ncbi:MAG: ATP-binding cassette domain-containing protein, partial [Chitinophagales bacterium]
EKIDGIQVIKAMRLEAYSSSEINASIDSLIKVQTKSKYIGLLNSILGTLIVTIASLFIIVLTAKEMIVNQSITLGMIISFVALSGKIFSAFNSLLSANLSLQEHQVILNRFFDFSERKQEATKNPQTPTTTSSGTAHLTISKGFQQFTRIRDFSLDKLSLRNVFFTYNEEKFVLKDISFDLNSGDKIWIQGSNGSGKSTLCKILGLLYEPSKGDVLLNGLQISMYNRQILRSKVLFVSGEDLIFNNTLLFNITFGRAVDMRRLIAYAKVLNFYEFIEQQPSQFDYVIHENGKNLSTGQRKKILLLRALLSDAEVLLVDEIFSGMDKASRQRAAQLISLINDRTFILISHLDIQDISFTKIYKLKHGQLLEQGT